MADVSRAFALSAVFPAETGSLPLATGLVRLAASVAGLAESLAYDLELCVSEAVTNAVRHGGGAKPVEFEVRFGEGAMVCTVTDSGPGFDFHAVPEPDFEAHPTGGYGLFIIREVMDEVGYEPEPGRNVLRMVKRLG